MLTPLKIFGGVAVIAIALFIVIQSGVVDTNNTIPPHNTTQNNNTPLTENGQKDEHLRPYKPEPASLGLENELIKAGWETNAAHAVVALNNEWFTIIKSDRPLELEKPIYLLKNLGYYSNLMPMFESHPETASLLAAANNPERLAQLLQNDDCYDIVTGLFAQHAGPEDAAALANALEIHRSLICRLVKRGLIGSQALFIFPRDNYSYNLGAQEYDHWLTEVLDNALAQSDDKLSSVINLLFEQGTDIRAKMINDGHFRYAFRNDLWLKFLRVTHKTQQPFELYLSDPHLWEFLALPQGERLLEQWQWFLSLEQINNLTPAAVLFGENAYPDPLQPLIIEAILENDTNTLVSLLYFGHEPLFVKLMQRDLSDDLKQQAFNILIAQGANYPATLENWSFAKKEFLQKMQRLLSNMGEKLSTFDITPTLQFLFKKMNVNRTTLKRINKKWDARLFMRQDAKVLVQIDHKKLTSSACQFFKVTSATGATGVVGEVAKELTCGLKDFDKAGKTIKAVKNSLESLPQQQRKFKAWQKNASAWWLMNAN